MKFTLKGDVSSKKNNRQHVFAKGRLMVIPGRVHRRWHDDAVMQMKALKLKPVIGRVRLHCDFYPSTKRRADCSNKFESVADLLVDMGIIADDNWFVVSEQSSRMVEKDALNPRCEVTLEPLE